LQKLQGGARGGPFPPGVVVLGQEFTIITQRFEITTVRPDSSLRLDFSQNKWWAVQDSLPSDPRNPNKTAEIVV
jgi:hypothetical protein